MKGKKNKKKKIRETHQKQGRTQEQTKIGQSPIYGKERGHICPRVADGGGGNRN